MDTGRTPILIGAGRITQREVPPKIAQGPADLMLTACRLAAEDAGLDSRLLSRVDSLTVIQCMTGIYPDLAGLVAERLGIKPADMLYTRTGGNMPQTQVNAKAEALSRGEIRLALICGAEALHSLVAALKDGATPDWAARDGATPAFDSPSFEGTADYEAPYETQQPVNVYPLFENALRAHYGRGLDEHQLNLGELFSKFSSVAAENPYSWFPTVRDPREIARPSESNRLVGFPYTKYMNAVIRVDQGAAMIMTTEAEARRLGIDSSRWVYLHGCADADDHWFVSEREDFKSSPALRIAGRKALEMAGVSLDAIDYFDLYSCFPSSVQIACNELGIPPDDPRPLTVTGGLPYHGGPGSNYVSHSIGTMMDRLRANPGKKGLCSGVGWYMTRHAIGIYSTDPVEKPWKREDPALARAEVDALPKPEVALAAQGTGTIEAYTVVHDRDGPCRGIVLGRLEDRRRFLAMTPDDPCVFEELMAREGVGRTGKVTAGTPVNRIGLD